MVAGSYIAAESESHCVVSCREKGSETLLGGVSLEYDPAAGPTKFMVGCEQGSVLSCNRKAKNPADRVGSSYMGHHGPVYGLKRCADGALSNEHVLLHGFMPAHTLAHSDTVCSNVCALEMLAALLAIEMAAVAHWRGSNPATRSRCQSTQMPCPALPGPAGTPSSPSTS